MAYAESSGFQCVVEGLEIKGMVHTGFGEIRDYLAIFEIRDPVTSRSAHYLFDLRMVSTTPSYKIPVLKRWGIKATSPDQLKWIEPHPGGPAPTIFAYGIEKCVEWFKESK